MDCVVTAARDHHMTQHNNTAPAQSIPQPRRSIHCTLTLHCARRCIASKLVSFASNAHPPIPLVSEHALLPLAMSTEPDAPAAPTSPPVAVTPLPPLSPSTSLHHLISSSPDPIVFIESSDHVLLALPLPIARRCHSLITRHLHSDLTPHGTALYSTITGDALIRCLGYVQHEWKEIERRKEKLAVLMKARGQKGSGSERVGLEGGEREGGGRRGKDREKNLLTSIQRAQEALLRYFSVLPSPPPPSSPPLTPPYAMGVALPTTPLATLLAPSSTLPPSTPLSHTYTLNHLLCELASSSYYLECPPLVDLTCQRLADSIQGKSPEEIRTTFNITNDFTPMEEEQVGKRVLERTMWYPGGVEGGGGVGGVGGVGGSGVVGGGVGGGLIGEDLGGEGGRGLIAGLNAGLNGTVGVREKLKVKLAEKRMMQMQQRGGATATPTSTDDRKEGSAGVGGGGGASEGGAVEAAAAATAKKRKKKKKKKGAKKDGEEEEKEPSSPHADDDPGKAEAAAADGDREEDERKVDGEAIQVLRDLTSSLISTAAALPPPSSAPALAALEATPVPSAEPSSSLPPLDTIALSDPSAPTLPPSFEPRDFPDPAWITLRLLFLVPVTEAGLQRLWPHLPGACYAYSGLTMVKRAGEVASHPPSPPVSSPSPLVHVCFPAQEAMLSCSHSAPFHLLLPLLRGAPPTVIVDMFDMWKGGRLMRCCSHCGMAGHLAGSPDCPLTSASPLPPPSDVVPSSHAVVTLRFLFRLALTPSLLPHLHRLLPLALFLHLGFHPSYHTPTHLLHVTFSSPSTMQHSLLTHAPSILHLMHSTPRIDLLDAAGVDVRSACPHCGEAGGHGRAECWVRKESEGLEPLSVSMLPPASFASVMGKGVGGIGGEEGAKETSASSAASAPSASSAVFATLGRIIDGAPAAAAAVDGMGSSRKRKAELMAVEEGTGVGVEEGEARGEVDESVREVKDVGADEDDDAALQELIDAKLSGLQQWEEHQLTAPRSKDEDDQIEPYHDEVDEQEGEEEEEELDGAPLFPSAAPIYGLMERSFCFCPMPSKPTPVSEFVWQGFLLHNLHQCSRCKRIIASPASMQDLAAAVIHADPSMAAVPHSLSAMASQGTSRPRRKREQQKRVEERKDRVLEPLDDDDVEHVELSMKAVQLQSQASQLPPPAQQSGNGQSANGGAPHQGPAPTGLQERKAAVSPSALSPPATAAAVPHPLPSHLPSSPPSDRPSTSSFNAPSPSADIGVHTACLDESTVSPTIELHPHASLVDCAPSSAESSSTVTTAASSPSCSHCPVHQSELTELHSLTLRLARTLDEQVKRVAVLEGLLKKGDDKAKRLTSLEERVKPLDKLDERIKAALDKADERRREEQRKLDKRLADELQRRQAIERWIEEENRERSDHTGERQRADRERLEERERRSGEVKELKELMKELKAGREAEEKKDRAEVRRMQARLGEVEKERERQWGELAVRLVRERERERGERDAREAALRAEWGEERRLAVEREGRLLSQLQLHSDVLARVDRKLQSIDRALLTSDPFLSRQRVVDMLGFDIGHAP